MGLRKDVGVRTTFSFSFHLFSFFFFFRTIHYERMNSAIISGLLLFVAMATATSSNHSLNFGKKNVQANAATDKTAVESEKAARAANADDGEDEAKGEDAIWTDFFMTLKAPWVNIWTALTALKLAKPK